MNAPSGGVLSTIRNVLWRKTASGNQRISLMDRSAAALHFCRLIEAKDDLRLTESGAKFVYELIAEDYPDRFGQFLSEKNMRQAHKLVMELLEHTLRRKLRAGPEHLAVWCALETARRQAENYGENTERVERATQHIRA